MFSESEVQAAYALPESSTEERRRATAATATAASQKRRNKRKATPAAAAASGVKSEDATADVADAGFVPATALEDAPRFRVESMHAFTQQFPHVNMNSQCELATAKLDVAKATLSKTTASKMRKVMADAGVDDVVVLSEYKKDLSKVASRRLQFDQSQHDPIEVELLRKAREKLVLPTFTHGLTMMSHKESSELVRRKVLRIPLYTADHETALLGQHAGTWTIDGVGTRTFPPCCYGVDCMGWASMGIVPGLNERVVFMRAMSPREWTDLVTTGAQPVGTAPCVLDGRLHTTRYVCKERLGLRPGHTLQHEEPDAVYQLWRNLMDEPGGYCSRYVFLPKEGEILTDPILAFHRSALHATKRPNGMWQVHQDTMVWRPPELLDRMLGENVQDFCAGADSTKKPMQSSSRASTASGRPCLTPAAVCSASGSHLSVRHTGNTGDIPGWAHLSSNWHLFDGQWIVDRKAADAVMLDPAVSELERDAAARIVDAFRAWPRNGGAHRFLPLDRANWEDGANIYTLPWLSRELANLSFNHDIANVKDPITALLSKVLNSRCQTRKYGTVAEKALFESPDDLADYTRVRAIQESVRTIDEARFYANYHELAKRRARIQQIVLCSLLGNYPHVAAADRHVTGATRTRLYELMHKGATGDAWFQSLLHGASMLVVWCVREYLVHALLDQPGLLAVVHGFMQFDQFRALTAQAMSAARLYIQQNLCHAWSSIGSTAPSDTLCRCMHKRLNQKKGSARAPKPRCLFAHVAWLRDMGTLLQPFHDSMLLIAYRKPDAGTLSFLMGKEVRTAAPLVPRDLSSQEREERERAHDELARSNNADKEMNDMRDMLNRSMGRVANAEASMRRYKHIIGDEFEARDASRKQADTDACSVAFVFTFLTPVQFQALSRLVEMGGPHMELADIVPFFCPHFGVPEADIDVIDFILTLINHHRNGTVTKHERMRQVVLLQQREPHAYNLLQVATELLKAQQRKRANVIGYLHADAAEAQVAALHRKSMESMQADDLLRVSAYDKCILKAEAKTRKDAEAWGLMLQQLRDDRQLFVDRIAQTAAAFAAHPMIEETSVHLYACSVCSTVFSNVRDAHSAQRKYYRWGLRSAEFNYMNDTLHCFNNKVSHLGHCATTPLHRVNLMGVRFALEKRAFQLCVKCGDIFSPTASTGECTDWSGRGLICCECTRVFRKELCSGDNDPAAAWIRQLPRDCVCCGALTRTVKHTYLYPFDLVVCYKHQNRRLQAFVQGVMGQMHDREGAQKIIRDYWVRTRANKLHATVRKGLRAMRANRQKNRMRKC